MREIVRDNSIALRCPKCHSTDVVELGKCWFIPDVENIYGCKKCMVVFGELKGAS